MSVQLFQDDYFYHKEQTQIAIAQDLERLRHHIIHHLKALNVGYLLISITICCGDYNMSSEASSTSTSELPKGMTLACIVMDINETSKEESGGNIIKGYNIKCPNCGRYNIFLAKSKGVTNALNHWRACVKEQAFKVFKERLTL